MRNIKEMNIKNRTFFSLKEINIKDFDPNLLKIDKKSYKNIDVYYIGYITVKDSDYVKISSVNPSYLIISEVDGYEKHGSKYLVFHSPNENNEALKKYNEPWDRIKNEIETINSGKKIEYDEDFMKIKFNSDENLPLNKTLQLHKIKIVIRSVFEEHCKFYLKFI